LAKTASADPFPAALAEGLAGQSKNRRALVAVSGGRDSVALLYGLHALGWKKLVVVHLDHQLRGRASTADAKFVGRLAASLGYPCEIGRAETQIYARERGLSLEHAARELRRVFFAAIARRTRIRTVFLAHHAEDQVETCLFNFLRGSGAAGLAGMRPETIQKIANLELTIARPMLGIRRAEIDRFLSVGKIRWREDASNVSAAHTRNRLRTRVLPTLVEEFGPAFPEAVRRAAEIFAAEDAWMRAEAARFGIGAELPVKPLQDAPLALRRRVVRAWLEEGRIPEAGFAEVERVLTLLDISSGPAKINLPGGRHARRREGKLFLE
jgi:tRNA(Ile)-lysidine synthase